MAAHFSIFAWRIPWTEEPSGLQSKRLQRVGHDQMVYRYSFSFQVWMNYFSMIDLFHSYFCSIHPVSIYLVVNSFKDTLSF